MGKKKAANQVAQATIHGLSHDGRGIATIDGKTVFIDGALPDEKVEFRYFRKRANYAEGRVTEVLEPSSQRQQAHCPHFELCGGCSLQHMPHAMQIELKQNTLLEQFNHFGQTAPDNVLAPLIGPKWHYRRKARLGVRYIEKKGKVLVGFRETNGRYLADLSGCPILHERVDQLISPLSDMLLNFSCKDQIPQIEVAVSDDTVALIFRHLVPLNNDEIQMLEQFATQHDIAIYLQPKNVASIHKLMPKDNQDLLQYQLTEHNVTFQFHPTDFTQVNAQINQAMVNEAVKHLQLNTEDKVLDLFCGLGNFSLPMARYAAHVTGVEGSDDMVMRAKHNAALNQLSNTAFYSADLSKDCEQQIWAKQAYNKVLLDPPRSGAAEIIALIIALQPERIVYVSCNPATLARDAGELTKQNYQLSSAGIMDMFPHTKHVESIAVFEKSN